MFGIRSMAQVSIILPFYPITGTAGLFTPVVLASAPQLRSRFLFADALGCMPQALWYHILVGTPPNIIARALTFGGGFISFSLNLPRIGIPSDSCSDRWHDVYICVTVSEAELEIVGNRAGNRSYCGLIFVSKTDHFRFDLAVRSHRYGAWPRKSTGLKWQLSSVRWFACINHFNILTENRLACFYRSGATIFPFAGMMPVSTAEW